MNHLSHVDITSRTISLERHFKPRELAQIWAFDESTIRRWFEDEPGVLKIGREVSRNGKRRKVSLRIPESVAERVHRMKSR